VSSEQARTAYYRYPDDSLEEPRGARAVRGDDLPDLDLASGARRLLEAAHAGGLPWDLTAARTPGGLGADLRVHHLVDRWSVHRWSWRGNQLVWSAHSPYGALRLMPAAIVANRREYLCGACGTWSRWTRGLTREGSNPADKAWWYTGRPLPPRRRLRLFACPVCDMRSVVEDCRTREGARR
jgi:hypothetical protein